MESGLINEVCIICKLCGAFTTCISIFKSSSDPSDKRTVLGFKAPHTKNGVFDVFNRRKILLQAAEGRTAYKL